ncbi:hypothetical protein TOI97_04790 [Denitrificimonas sp. JX-1]|uniref:Polyphosphate kinase-2-related domain-containing protein n=1 Tax=Denitrificimonas halotolerans TaxID=3098930 RepID=A0ABU5GPG1_9GAMM|nr:hypothetical protein [Denitrificimonas sp. JX-1]MDY7218887.1 hypothetical protein [Denitrificimonas sp. JX-1]
MRLADTLLNECIYNPKTGLNLDPGRNFGLTLRECDKRLKALRTTMDRQQQLLWANSGPAILIWLQGPDCSGKDGVIRNSLRGLNPQGVRVSDFQKPTEQQRRDNFLTRFREKLPTPGVLTIFNRTPYEGLVSDLADGYINESQASGRLQQLFEFEDELSSRHIHLIKMYLHVSKDEQKSRLQQRFVNPEKHWKISEADLSGHQQFEYIQNNWNQAFKHSSTTTHPWYILPANNKPVRNLLFCSLIAQKFEQLNLHWPQPKLPFNVEDLDEPWSPAG